MNKVQVKLIKDAMENGYLLSKWEFNFINDLAIKDQMIGDYYPLSKEQDEVLNKISDKVNSG